MKFSDVIEFRKDVYFEGAVQADWFYNSELSAKVAMNYVFHGNLYFDGVLEQFSKNSNRVDSVTLLKKIAEKFIHPGSNPLTLAIADYGTGKSHLAVTMGHLFSGPKYCPTVYNRVISNISKISSEEAEDVEKLYTSTNFVLMLNGMKDFNLNSELLQVTQKSLKLYGVDSSFLSKISKTQETATNFLAKTEKSSIEAYEKYAMEKGWLDKGAALINKLKENLLTDDDAFSIVDSVFYDVTGQNISWTNGISARAILDLLVSELCEKQKIFDHIVILFDEFGRFLEYAAGVNNSGKTGDSALQQMFESAQDAKGKIQIVNFIQSDIKTYLQRVDRTSNISRYIGRYDASDKYHISSNLETVFANLIYRKNRKAFEDIIIMWQCNETKRWQLANTDMNRWLPTKGIWREYRSFRDVIVEGIYPLHPLSTYMLTQLSDYLQKRSSLALINTYIEQLKDVDIETEKPLIMPEELMRGDLFNEMLSAEESGRQTSQFCIAYNSIISRVGDKLSEEALKVLRANLILRILRFKTNSYEDVKKAICFCTGLEALDVNKALKLLEHEYAVLGFDNYANCFDFMAEAHGYHEYKIQKNQNLAKVSVTSADLDDIQIRKLFDISEPVETDFGINHNIQTAEWLFKQYLYPIEKINDLIIKSIITEWTNAKSYNVPKGQLIWIYINKDSKQEDINKLTDMYNLIEGKPILLMLINDSDNALWKLIQEYKCLNSFDDINRKKFDKYYNEDFDKVRLNIQEHFKNLKKQRSYISESGVSTFSGKLSRELTKMFENIYKKVIPFNFDGFIGPQGIASYFTIFSLLLSESISYDSIHNFPINVRNRIESVLSYEAGNSWKCLGRDGSIMPPENESVKEIFNAIKNEYISKKSLSLATVFLVYSQHPYGLCEEVIMLLIAVLIANMNYGTKISYKNNVYSISDWKGVLTSDRKTITENERKRIISIVKESALIQVDAGAVEEKFLRILDTIDVNKSLKSFSKFETELNELISKESVPQVLKNRITIAEKTIKDGINAYRTWNEEIARLKGNLVDQPITDKVIKALDTRNTVVRLNEKYADIYQKYLAEELDEDVNNLKTTSESIITANFAEWLATLKCINEDSMYELKYIEKTYAEKLRNCNFEELAQSLEKHINTQIKDIDSIKERVSLRKDLESFINKNNISEYTPIQSIDDIIDTAEELFSRVVKNESSFDDELRRLSQHFKVKMNRAQDIRKEITREVSDVKTKISTLRYFEDIADIQTRINKLYGRGINREENPEFDIFLTESKNFQNDYRKLSNCKSSLKEFNEIKDELLEKYKTVSINFNQIKFLNSQIEYLSSEFKFMDIKWRRENLEVDGKERRYLIAWKDEIQNLPDYLSESTLKEIENTKIKVEEVLSKQNIQTVIEYFEKLSTEEKEKCLEQLNKIINGEGK